jgi:hypothetical protein
VLVILPATAVVFYLHSRKAQAFVPQSGIVVADFANTTGDPVFDDTLRQAVSIDLGQSPFLNVVSERRVAAVLKRMGKPADERLSRQTAREVCLRTSSKALIAGSIVPSEPGYQIQLEALNCATGDTLAKVLAEAPDRDAVVRAIDNADEQLRRKLGESLPSLRKFGRPLADATTSSLDALQVSARHRLCASRRVPRKPCPT